MNIYDYIDEQKVKYDKPVILEEGWDWSMKEHLRRSFLYINSQFDEHNDNRTLRPNKNIILPIMNIQYRTEGFDVKDIELYVENPEEAHKSLLIDKFHHKWALENSLDTFIDDMVVEYCNYGGVLVRKTDEARPEVIDLRSIAFCNQTDLLNHPFGIKHVFSPSELRKMKKWGESSNGATITIEELITLVAKEEKDEIEVFEVHGELPVDWLEDSPEGDEVGEEEDISQIQIVAYYRDENQSEQGVTLFKNKEPKSPFKFLSRDKVVGRALGRGGVEELFEPQIWSNWNEVKITEMLDSAAKTLHWTDDPSFKARNNLSNVENGEVLNLGEGRQLSQVDTFPRNLVVFNDSLERWQNQAQLLGSASEGLLGESPSAGTPFKLFEAQNIEAKSMHRYRQGQLAVFMDELYREWILPHLAREIVKEQTFLAELSVDEMQRISENLAQRNANNMIKRRILSGQIMSLEAIEELKRLAREGFLAEGNKQFLKILEDEMKDISMSVFTNIAGKQKNLALLTDKLTNVLRQYFATPELRQDPEMAKILNTILESSGLSPIMFGPLPQQQQPQQQALPPQQPQPVPQQQPV